jgi:hypothetical protein
MWWNRLATWLVMRRDVSDSLKVVGAPAVHVALVLDLRTRSLLAGVPGRAREEVVRGALAMAANRPMDRRRPAPPGRVLCAPDLAEQVRIGLDALDLDVPIEEMAPDDRADDVFDSLVAAMAGRRPAAHLPAPEDWAWLYAQARRFLERRPWERWDDGVSLHMQLEVGRSRREAVGVVLGAAGHQHGLVLYPGSEVPASARAGRAVPESMPGGTTTMFLDADGAPPDLVAKARRYGWPGEADLLPTFVGWDGQARPGELEAATARALTVALAAVLDHDARWAEPADMDTSDLRGELQLAGGLRGRYRLAGEPSRRIPAQLARSGVLVVGGEVREDLLPGTSELRIGRVPWQELDKLRRLARCHQPSPKTGKEAGDGLPLVIVHPPRRRGDDAASRIAEVHPTSIAVIEEGPEDLLLLLSEAGVFGLGATVRGDAGIASFHQRLRATGGCHGVVVADRRGSGFGPVYGFFELHLAPAPGPQPRTGASRRKSRSRPRAR